MLIGYTNNNSIFISMLVFVVIPNFCQRFMTSLTMMGFSYSKLLVSVLVGNMRTSSGWLVFG